MRLCWAGLLGLRPRLREWRWKWACARGLREVGSTAGPRKEKEKQAEQAFGLAMRGVLSISKSFSISFLKPKSILNQVKFKYCFKYTFQLK